MGFRGSRVQIPPSRLDLAPFVDRVVDRVVEIRESLFAQFAGLRHHRIERFRVHQLVAGLQRADVEPVTHVHNEAWIWVLCFRRYSRARRSSFRSAVFADAPSSRKTSRAAIPLSLQYLRQSSS